MSVLTSGFILDQSPVLVSGRTIHPPPYIHLIPLHTPSPDFILCLVIISAARRICCLTRGAHIDTLGQPGDIKNRQDVETKVSLTPQKCEIQGLCFFIFWWHFKNKQTNKKTNRSPFLFIHLLFTPACLESLWTPLPCYSASQWWLTCCVIYRFYSHFSFKTLWKKCELFSQKSGESVNVCHELGEIQVDSDPGRPNVL